jgi:alkyldihydroxyacetonephosphate synthase
MGGPQTWACGGGVRRWNGWGDDGVSVPLGPDARSFLERALGAGHPWPDASLETTLASLPASALPQPHPLVTTEPAERLRHARGQSLPDWIAVRSGRLGWAPDGVAHPTDADEIRALFRFAVDGSCRLIPYGGGTSVTGHLTPPPGGPPTVTVVLDRLAGLRQFDERSGLATFGAGTPGPALEAELRPLGRMLGHFPQSFELSTVGGWVATRSAGQQSQRFGRIEAMFAGGHLESPAGPLEMRPFPASAAGPDLRQLVLGSEGRLGILTDVTVRSSPLPEDERYVAAFLPDFERGLATARALADARVPVSMIRLSTPVETATVLAMAGHRATLEVYRRYLRLRGIGRDRCLLLVAITGDRALVRHAAGRVGRVVRTNHGLMAPGSFGRRWAAERFRSAYLRNGLWEAGYAVDTVETATTWDRLAELAAGVARAVRHGLEAEGERVHAFSHCSHVYPSGSSLYTTFLFRRADEPDETLRRWAVLKGAASRAIVDGGGTISHQHGVGRDHAAYLATEIGSLGLAALGDVARRFDPDGIMNTGALLADEPAR